jgi:hypothetical protein
LVVTDGVIPFFHWIFDGQTTLLEVGKDKKTWIDCPSISLWNDTTTESMAGITNVCPVDQSMNMFPENGDETFPGHWMFAGIIAALTH